MNIQESKRIVIKIGTSSITHSNGHIHLHKMDLLVRQIADLFHSGKEVVIVSSGAVAAGLSPLGLATKPDCLEAKQAAAAVGQSILMNMYGKLFQEYGITVGQILLTRGDYLQPKHYVHARNTLQRLLSLRVIPIVNENDTVSTAELKIGDNDTLSAMVGSIIDADTVIILSDVDGLYTANPQTSAEARLIPEVRELTAEIYQMASGAGTLRGTGGMQTKLQAADICMNSGVNMLITSASIPNVLLRLQAGDNIGTFFFAHDVHPQMRKRSLLLNANMAGSIYVDEGCKNALLEKGSSLLPIGITRIEGEFEEGDGVSIYYGEREIARGIAGFSAAELRLLAGERTDSYAEVLGYQPTHTTAVHRNDLVIKH